jgi:hypothetical protein
VRQGRRQAFGVKDRFVFEHEIDGAGQFDGDDGVGLELVAAQARFQSLRQRPHELMIAFGDDGRFAKGPAQIRVAEPGPAQSLDLAGAGHRAFDQATVGKEVFDRGETADVADLVEEGQAQVLANAGNRLEQGVIAAGDFFGQTLELGFQSDDLGVEMADQSQFVFDGQLADGMIFAGQELFLPGIAIVAVASGEGGTVVGQLMGLEPRQQIGSLPDEVGALTQERAQWPHGGGINVGRRDEIGPEQVSEFFGVEAVVLVFAAVNGLEIEGVGQDEGQAGVLTGVGLPREITR